MKKETQESLEQSFTPSLTRRLGRSLIEQTRRSLTRSPSVSREGRARSAERDASEAASSSSAAVDRSVSTVSDQSEYKHRSASDRRAIRRTNSLLESATGSLASPRRTVVGLFDDEDDLADHRHLHGRSSFFSTFPRDTVARGNLGRWYNETGGGRASTGRLRKDSFRSYRTDKIQEETSDDAFAGDRSGSISEYASTSACDSNTNPLDDDPSPTESCANNAVDYKPAYKSDTSSRNLENRLLAAENLIRESKLKNLGSSGGVNLTSSYRDTDKCEKRSLISVAETPGASATSKRRSCIPSLRLRSGSLTREPSAAVDRRKSLADSQDVANLVARTLVPERSLLSKFFKTAASRSENEPTRDKERETEVEKEKEKPQKSKQRRISRFLRPDFFDTPREESRYAKEKEAQKAAENERRKSRFIKRKSENKDAAAVPKTTAPTTTSREGSVETEKKRDKELKNEINCRRRDRCSRERETTATETTEPVEGSRNGFLHSLEKKLESLRCNDEQRASGREKTTVKSATSDERTIGNEASRERSAPPIDRRLSSSSNERVTLERASSVEDLSRPKNPKRSSPKSRVSSVLGLFKTVDPKQLANGTRSQTTILGKLKKSPPKALADLASVEDATTAPTVGSKIPTKLVANADAKSTKKIGETNKSDKPEKRVSSCESSRRFASKEGPKQDGTPSTAKERSASREKESAGERGNWNRDAEQGSTDARREKPNDDDEKRSTEKRSVAIPGNRGKRANRCSLENGASSTEPSRSENAEKKTGKPTKKTCETSESNDSDGVKKKRIVRVTKKVVKKSTVSGGGTGDKSIDKSGDADKTSEGKEKSAKPRTKKKVIGICDKTPVESKVAATVGAKAGNAEENGLGTESGDKSEERAANDHPEEETVETETNDDEPTKIQRESQRPNRNNLKLDLSKIPQHSFRNATPKRDSPKSDSPSSTTNQDLPGKLMECLSKVTHRASIAGNKIIVDKPLRARDVAELKREVTECAKIIESHAESAVNAVQGPPEERKSSAIASEVSTENDRPITSATTAVTGTDYPNDVLSPMDDPESFDSWSISSAELSHARPDLHSPTSPSHSLYARNDNSDNSESVIDRIRRRSFYSRFNDRRRPSLTAPPPGVALPGSATLPRKFSFSGHREHRDRGRYGTGYAGFASAVTSKTGGSGGGGGSSGNRYATDKRYGFYSEDGVAIDRRNRSLDRAARYSDAGYVTDLKSPTEHPVVLSSSYDPLRRYLRSPTFDLSASRSRYHSADFTADPDLATVYRPSASSLSNDSVSLGYSSLPRKYAIGLAEPKTVQYYEELLSPSTADYSPSRRSPTCSEYPTRCENGYYNGNSDLRANAAKRKTCTENARTLELYEDTDPASTASCDERSTEQRR